MAHLSPSLSMAPTSQREGLALHRVGSLTKSQRQSNWKMPENLNFKQAHRRIQDLLCVSPSSCQTERVGVLQERFSPSVSDHGRGCWRRNVGFDRGGPESYPCYCLHAEQSWASGITSLKLCFLICNLEFLAPATKVAGKISQAPVTWNTQELLSAPVLVGSCLTMPSPSPCPMLIFLPLYPLTRGKKIYSIELGWGEIPHTLWI